jgi:hypothetical protein
MGDRVHHRFANGDTQVFYLLFVESSFLRQPLDNQFRSVYTRQLAFEC